MDKSWKIFLTTPFPVESTLLISARDCRKATQCDVLGAKSVFKISLMILQNLLHKIINSERWFLTNNFKLKTTYWPIKQNDRTFFMQIP